MKYFLFVIYMSSHVTMASQMQGFGARYYQEDSAVPEYNTNKDLVPDVFVGNSAYTLECSRLSDIATTAGVTVNQDEQALWLCLSSAGINYWFISDNERGQGDLTSIAIAKADQQKSCLPYSGDLRIII